MVRKFGKEVQEILLISAGMKRAAYVANRVSHEVALAIERYRKQWLQSKKISVELPRPSNEDVR